MILNASHEITNCGLPLEIQERYVRYKQGNRAIVAWMTTYGPDKYKGRKTLPIKQMIALGRFLCDKVQNIGCLPPDVDYYFRDVIKERAYLSQHFRQHRDRSETDDLDTINHEHFTESLKQIHQILLTAGHPKKPKLAEVTDRPNRSRSFSKLQSPVQESRFSFITDEDDGRLEQSDEDTMSDNDTDATSDCSHSTCELLSNTSLSADQCDDFLDSSGPFARGVETVVFLNKIEAITKAVQACWTEAGKLGANVTASAAYTNVLIQQATHYSWEFLDGEQCTVDFQTTQQRIEDYYRNSGDVHSTENCQHGLLELSKALAETEKSLLSDQISTNPQSYNPQSSRSQILIDRLTTDLSLISTSCVSSDLAHEWLAFVKLHDGASVNLRDQFTNCIILYIISLSHGTYSQALAKPALIAVPRISALKLANEALSTIRHLIDDKTIFPCQCINTLGYRMADMRDSLDKFVKFKCWNTLMQSPLVAGNHTLEILDLCSYYGMHLLHYRHYVGSVLHTYNALVQLNFMEKAPVLDQVMELFMPVLFTTGKQPDSGFMASWLRYIGARLKFKAGKKHQNHKDTWCMSIPAHSAAKSAGLNIDGKNDAAHILPKFDYGTIDSTMKLKHGGWIVDEEQQQQLDALLQGTTDPSSCQTILDASGTPKQRTSSSKNYRKTKHNRSKSHVNYPTRSTHQPSSDANVCSDLYRSILSTFTHDASSERKTIPPSHFNLLAFFHSMTKVIAGISDTTHQEPSPPPTSASPSSILSSPTSDSGKGQMCLCFTQTILRAADRVLDTRKRCGLDAKGATLSKNERECVDCFKGHLLKVLDIDGVTSETGQLGGKWLWESVM